MVLSEVFTHKACTKPEIIVAAFSLIPRDSFIKPGSIVRFLIIDCVLSGMSTGTWSNELTVNDIKIPSQFVVLRVVTCIAKKETAIKGLLFVKGIYRLDGCVKNMSRIEHGKRYCRCSATFIRIVISQIIEGLAGRFFVVNMCVRQGKKTHKRCSIVA